MKKHEFQNWGMSREKTISGNFGPLGLHKTEEFQ